MKFRCFVTILLAVTAVSAVSSQQLRRLAQVKAGSLVLSSYGDVPQGARVDYLRAMRTGESVTLYLLASDDSQQPLVYRVENYGENPAYGVFDGKTRVAASYMSIGNSGSVEGVSKTVPAGGAMPVTVRFDNVAATVDTVPLIYAGFSGWPELDAVSRRFGYSFENVGLVPQGAREAFDLKGPVMRAATTTADGMSMGEHAFTLAGHPAVAEPSEHFEYNLFGQLMKTDSPEQGATVTYTYDRAGNLTEVRQENDDYGSVTVVYRDPHDPYALITRMVETLSDGTRQEVSYGSWQIDAYGNWIRRQATYPGGNTVTELREIEYFPHQ